MRKAVRRWRTWLRAWRVRGAIALLLLAAILVVAYRVGLVQSTSLATFRDVLLTLGQVLILLLLLTLVVLVCMWVVRPDDRIRLLPFENATSNPDLKGTSELLMAELQRIREIHHRLSQLTPTEPLQHRKADPLATRERPGVLSNKAIRISSDLPQGSIVRAATIGVGPATISVGDLLLALKDMWPFVQSPPVLAGSLQRYGKGTWIVARMSEDQDTHWWTASSEADTDERLPDLVRDLAYKMMLDRPPTADEPPHSWQSFKEFTEGLAAYEAFTHTQHPADRDRARDHCLAARKAEAGYRSLANLFSALGDSYFADSEWASARDMYANAWDLTTDPNTLNNLAVTFDREGDAGQAAQLYKQILVYDPGFALAYSNLARNLLGRRELQQAESVLHQGLTQAREKDPYLPNLYADLSSVLRAGAHFDAALPFAEKGVELSPDLPATQLELGMVRFDSTAFAEAIGPLEAALSLNPPDPGAWIVLSLALFGSGRSPEAIDCAEQAVERIPNDPAILENLGRVYALNDRLEDAALAKKAALDINPDQPAQHAALAGYYKRLGRQPDYLKELELAKAGEQKMTDYDRACLASISGDSDRAMALLPRLLKTGEISPGHVLTDPDWWFLRDDARFKALIAPEVAG